MTGSPSDNAKPLSQKALRELVSDLAGKIDRLEQEVEQLRLDNSNLRIDNQALKDETTRHRNMNNLVARCEKDILNQGELGSVPNW